MGSIEGEINTTLKIIQTLNLNINLYITYK